MFPHSRPSPRSASAANNLQTNPNRTNNQRDHTSDRSSTHSEIPPYSDLGSENGDGDGEMVGRAERASEVDQKTIMKVNQVIQVRTTTPCSLADMALTNL
jgi:autophagy-related protein 13